MNVTTQRIIIGISGASGFQYGVKALELLKPLDLEVHLVVSKGAERTCELETDYQLDKVMSLADVVHPISNLGASISSGSFKTLGMLVAPCSM
ncbi:aromatic acid decarboxylase, partial [Enterobacter sp. 63]